MQWKLFIVEQTEIMVVMVGAWEGVVKQLTELKQHRNKPIITINTIISHRLEVLCRTRSWILAKLKEHRKKPIITINTIIFHRLDVLRTTRRGILAVLKQHRKKTVITLNTIFSHRLDVLRRTRSGILAELKQHRKKTIITINTIISHRLDVLRRTRGSMTSHARANHAEAVSYASILRKLQNIGKLFSSSVRNYVPEWNMLRKSRKHSSVRVNFVSFSCKAGLQLYTTD